MIEALQAVIAIVLIDLALSGDNALVIGMAARGLPDHQRRRAIVFGGLAAVALRVIAASVVTLLLQIPYLQLIASIVLVLIAYRLVRPVAAHGRTVREATTLPEAVTTILIADAAMSIENILGVGAAAHGNIALLVFGLGLSIPIVLFGSDLVVRLLDRFPRGIWLGAFALVWTAAEMLVDEPALHVADTLQYADLVLAALLMLLIVAARGALSSRGRGRRAAADPGD
ncbi:MAG: TerC family protein [Chloroflexi bacterium]|nr:TerC family protein [Chloroflexota bacterium]